jgi:hypothetical protein
MTTFSSKFSPPPLKRRVVATRNKKRNTWQRPGGSNLKGRVDYGNTPWARMLRDNAEELEQPDIVAGKLFRLRFRIPYPVFLKLLGWTKPWHEKRTSDTVGRERRPTELKLLGVLRILGRDTCFDGIKELSEHPNIKRALVEAEAAYSLLGLPGAIGSVYVVHTPCCMCPSSLSNLCTGKEGYVPLPATWMQP